eukprot:TRINITY_DN8122_c0_g1_i3.p1 TRINITY_DN8122_c0_g1~~TRINITY_DN8122_c0_g1_i3.p1  ORF type:complete len:160 (-),score=44.32 TRINITY_DN8122_c0_g1_i3:171-623(-)
MIRRPPRSTQSRSSAASDVYKRQLYAQYGNGNLQILHSKTHGRTFEQPIEVKTNGITLDIMAMCGENGKGVLFIVNLLFAHSQGYVGFLKPYERSLTRLKYPLWRIPVVMEDNPELACGYIGDNQYSVVMVVKSFTQNCITFAHGILNNV